ncbi:MAG: hypothetical protein HKN95_02870, partial [Acidimicrobiia bacterium]|nr:hypothetical protein [Acidimicrobiia bacterium]
MSRARVGPRSVVLALCASVLLPLCARGAVAVELAGRPLGEYPHFEHVNVFNANEAVSVGVDPSVSTALVDVTCPVYVVAAKTASEWQSDPSLADVRSGGPGTATFAAGSILANIVTVADPDELDADAGTGLGVGYDVVIDVDGDGQLGAPDHIDGAGDEAAFYVVGDTTALGPLPVTAVEYSATGVTPGFEMERIWHPADIGAMGRLPVVIISHGNGHQHTWYDYLQEHLASYGYVVMSHQNNTLPGIDACSQTTLEHTDAFLGQLASIAGGALVGHIDSSRIMWIGHSRGGEGVVRAFDKLGDGEWTSVHYDANDIVLISSIAPTDFLGPGESNPHGANYHLLYGSADGDVSGDPSSLSVNSFSIYERAEGYRQSTYVQGADHNDFNSDGYNDFWGPPGTEIGREEAQQVAKGIYLPLIKHYVESSVPARDYLWRQYERFRPIGVSTGTVVVSEYKVGPANGRFVIDDYQDRLGVTNTSSSGGAVRFSVTGLEESLLKDQNASISIMDPMNGMLRARPEDTTWGAVFQWDTDAYLEFDVVAAARDFAAFECLSLRACQIPRHVNTMVELDDLTFTVTLHDGSGGTSSINIGSYGGGIEEPYQREGGWQTEFETIRIPLDEFLRDGRNLDLGDVTMVRLDFGPSSGSAVGAIGLDDVELVKEDTRGGAEIVFDSAAVADAGGGNGDLLLNPGETADLNVNLRNVGFYPSLGVTATLSTTDPYVSVLDAAAAFGDMPGGGPAQMAQDPFTIQVAPNCPTPHEVSMVMDITDAAGTNWTASFDVVVYTSSQVSGTVTRDGVPEPGVTITWSGPLPGSVLTDANGDYLFGSIAGTYDVVASKGDWLSSAPAVVTIPSSATGVDFAFTTAVISGRVTDLLSGGPVEGATITHTGGLEGSVLTDSSGDYTIAGVYGRPTTLSLAAGHPSYFDSDPQEILQPP